MRLGRIVAVGVCAVWPAGARVFAGPDHIESGDAGSMGSTSQKVTKTPFYQISGALQSTRGARSADREDMYKIQIVNPSQFFASTDPNDCVGGYCGSSSFDSRLWLFEIDERGKVLGLLANDERQSASGTSKVTNVATDESGAQLTSGGVYLLVITTADNDPVSFEGGIFDIESATEVSGPDGEGGSEEHSGWTGGGEANVGSYQIVVQGADGVGAVGAPAMTPFGVGALSVAVLSGGAMTIARAKKQRRLSLIKATN